jgi:thiamine biosynthesis lipoprotein ApbE
MTTDFRALCAELLDEVVARPFIPDSELISRARAALAEPEPEGPTVMEIIELADEIEAAELGQVDLVRAALARWGHQPAPLPAGEVEP